MLLSNYPDKKLFSIFIIFFLIGIIGFAVLGFKISGYIFAHIGALGLLGLFGVGAAYYADKKGYNKNIAFNLGFSLAILAGLIESTLFVLFGDNKQFICGGAASLILALIVFLIYLLLKQKNIK